jgi:hypothetical protein
MALRLLLRARRCCCGGFKILPDPARCLSYNHYDHLDVDTFLMSMIAILDICSHAHDADCVAFGSSPRIALAPVVVLAVYSPSPIGFGLCLIAQV